MTHDPNRRSTIELFSDAMSDASALIGTEAKLMRAEISDKVDRAVGAVGMMVIAAVFFIGALFLLLQTGVAFLVEYGWSTAVASIAMAIVSAIIGLILFFVGKSALSADKLRPNRTIDQVNRDVAVARQAVSSGPASQVPVHTTVTRR